MKNWKPQYDSWSFNLTDAVLWLDTFINPLPCVVMVSPYDKFKIRTTEIWHLRYLQNSKIWEGYVKILKLLKLCQKLRFYQIFFSCFFPENLSYLQFKMLNHCFRTRQSQFKNILPSNYGEWLHMKITPECQ